MTIQVKIAGNTIKARVYTFPARGSQTEDYHLIIGGEKINSDRARTTSGSGKAYTYFKTKDQVGGNQSYWVEGHLASGTKIEVMAEAAAPAKIDAPKAALKPAAAKATPVAVKPSPGTATPAAPKPLIKKRGSAAK